MLGSYIARMGMTLAGSLLRPRLGALDESRLPIRVWPSDIDVFGHLNNGRFLTLMDIGRFDHSLRTGLVAEALKRRWHPVVAAATVRFRRELRTFAPCELTSRLAFWDERAFFFEHRFEHAGTVHARGYIRGVNKSGGRTVPPAEMFEAVGYSGPPPQPPEELRLWISSLKG